MRSPDFVSRPVSLDDRSTTATSIGAADKRIRRQILCSLGEPAQVIAERVLALSRAALDEPPLEHLTAADGAEETALLARRMESACDRLAAFDLAQRQRQQGVEIVTPDELQIWLLVSLIAGSSHDQTAPDVPPAANPTVTVESLHQVQAVLAQVAWQRLRAHVAWRVVLLLEAAEQAALVQWTEALRASGAAALYVVSPVNAHYLRLAQAAWVEQAAQSITALLWTSPPAHTEIERAANAPSSLVAAGACVWCSPARALHTWLAHSGAAHCLAALCQELDAAQPGVNAPARLPSLHEDLAALRRLSPPVLPPATHTVRPGWAALAQLPAQAAENARQQEAVVMGQWQPPRLGWLDAAQTEWLARLAELAQEYSPAGAWPRLGAYLAALQELRGCWDQLAQIVGEQMELIAQQLDRARQDADAARSRLEAVCYSFPPCSAAGAALVLFRPWRWARWAYDYWQSLPAAARRLAAANATLLRCGCEEAAWHTLRQHYLAAAQQTQAQLDRLRQAQQNFLLAAKLATDAAGWQAAQIPEPWSAQRLEWLQQRLLPDERALPVGDVLAAASQRQDTPAAIFSRLQARIGAEVDEVADWSALDCLYAAFVAGANAAQPLDKQSLLWLDQQLQVAVPPWPAQELAENSLTEDWWALPEPRARAEWLSGALTLVEGWRAHSRHIHTARSALDAIQLIRWAEIRVDLEEPDALAAAEEEDGDDNVQLV